MTTAHQQLSRIAGITLGLAGAMFIGIQINHPELTLQFVATPEFVIRQILKTVMTVLALIGLTSLYARDARRLGSLGLAGYILFTLGYLAMFSVEIIATTVLPVVVHTDPAYVQDVLTAAYGGVPVGDIGGVGILNGLAGVGYMIGGLVFGIALFRSAVVVRWAGALLAVATAGTLALAVLPDSFNRFFAIPAGIALMGIGWSARRQAAPSPVRESVLAEASR